MNQLKRTSFKNLNQMTLDIAEKFFIAKKMREETNKHLLAERSINEDNPYDSYLLKVQAAYDALDELEKNLINNEFFYQNYNRWWEPLYSKASFYRYKKEAMLKFLGAFYDI